MVDNALQHGKPPVIVKVEPGQVSVLDRGFGFADTDHKSTFARFRPGPASSGFGLGLPLIASVARVHGGSIQVTNRADGPGAEVVLKLP
jgi:two-component system sensor histidine kinase PrrB